MNSSKAICPDTRNRAEEIAGIADTWLTGHWKILLSLAAVLCVLTFAGYSHAKQIWIDETLQMLIAGQPTVQQTWDQLKDGYIQVDPPILHVLQHFLLSCFRY